MKLRKAPRSRRRTKRTGPTVFSVQVLTQSDHTLYLFSAKASLLYSMLSINRRIEDKDEGYQRTLSVGRVESIAQFVKRKMPLPGAIIISFDEATYDSRRQRLTVPIGSSVGWVLDGQHRLAGAHVAARNGLDIELPVVAFVGLSLVRQIEQFVVINREGRNVPTSLYLDLLGKLPNKKAGDFAKERASDIANQLKRDEDSVFFQRIIVTSSPSDGQISLTNFVRKLAPLVALDKGLLHVYTEKEQRAVIENYFKAMSIVFPREFTRKGSMFFRTLGFGALWNVFPNFFSITLKDHQGFRVKDAVEVFKNVADFDFSKWQEYGTGNQAENNAAADLRTALLMAFREGDGNEGTLRL